MACRTTTTVFKTLFLTEPWLPFPRNHHRSFITPAKPSTPPPLTTSTSNHPQFSISISISRVRYYHFLPPNQQHIHITCSYHNNPSSHDDPDQGPPQEAILKAISDSLTVEIDSEVSKTEGRVGQTTNVVIGGTVTDDSTNEWLTLDQKVNSYPTVRGFTAIGTGGDDFVQAMVVAVESVLQQPIPEGQVKQKISSGGKYVSVNIGPVQVVSSEQVQAVYNAMRRDDRMKYFL